MTSAFGFGEQMEKPVIDADVIRAAISMQSLVWSKVFKGHAFVMALSFTWMVPTKR